MLSVSLGNKRADQSKALSCVHLFAYNNYNDSRETQVVPGASHFLLFFPFYFFGMHDHYECINAARQCCFSFQWRFFIYCPIPNNRKININIGEINTVFKMCWSCPFSFPEDEGCPVTHLLEAEESFGTHPGTPKGPGLASPGNRDRRRWRMLEAPSQALVLSIAAFNWIRLRE